MSAKLHMGASCKTRSARKASIDANPAAHPAAPGQGMRLSAVSPPFALRGCQGDEPSALRPAAGKAPRRKRSHRGSVPGPHEAETSEKALAIARAIVADNFDTLDFGPYYHEIGVNEIAICGDDYYDELAVWRDDKLRLRRAAADLLSAAKRVLEHWESGDLAEAVRELSAAVAKAEGGEA
jgi:hypothetical protein